MTLVRRVARPLLASVVVVQGLDLLKHPAALREYVAPFAEKMAPLGVPNDPELLVRANGAAMVGAGGMLALGRFPRTSALVLAAAMAPTTYVGHPFWEQKDPATRRQHRVAFLKNLSLIGGLLLASVDTEGRPGVAYRLGMAGDSAKRTARHARHEARHAAHIARREAQHARHEARHAARAARREAKLAATQAHDALT